MTKLYELSGGDVFWWGKVLWRLPPSENRWKIRSKTFQGIADAMAQQWGDVL